RRGRWRRRGEHRRIEHAADGDLRGDAIDRGLRVLHRGGIELLCSELGLRLAKLFTCAADRAEEGRRLLRYVTLLALLRCSELFGQRASQGLCFRLATIRVRASDLESRALVVQLLYDGLEVDVLA